MDAGINNVIYMELHLGPKMVNGTCGKTIVAGTTDRGSTVPPNWNCHLCLKDADTFKISHFSELKNRQMEKLHRQGSHITEILLPP